MDKDSNTSASKLVQKAANLMEDKVIKLSDASGGLNNHDSPANLKPNEFFYYENIMGDEGGYPGKKRRGKKLIQYAPIDPKPYPVDGNSIFHYKCDEDTILNTLLATVDDDGLMNYDLAPQSNGAIAPSVKALFPIGAGLGRQAIQEGKGYNIPGNSYGVNSTGTCMRYQFGVGSSPINAAVALTMRGWVIIPEEFNGKSFQNPVAPIATSYSNNGTPLFGTALSASGLVGQICNGFRLWRDWDEANQKSTSSPYVTFTLRTSGIAGTITVLNSGPISIGALRELKATYDSVSGLLELSVQGIVKASATVVGAGPVDDSLAAFIAMFGGDAQGTGSPGIGYKTAAGVTFDEWEVSNVVRSDTPYANPRGNPMVLQKANGTYQEIVAANTGLYFTVGDANWTPIQDGFSPTAQWDGKQIGDILYMTNGVDTPKTWDGTTLRDCGERKTPVTAQDFAAATGLDPGVYRWIVTMVFGDAETGPSAYIELTLSVISQVLISDIPLGPATCTARRIYRTKEGPSDDDPYYLVRELSDNTTTVMDGAFTAGGSPGPTTDTGRDGVPDATLGTGDYAQMNAVVATTSWGKPKYLLAAFNRIMAAGYDDAEYTMGFTELSPGIEVRPAANFVKAESDKGPLIALGLYYGEIQASKDGNATLVLRGDNPDNWEEFETLHPTIGCIDHWGFVHRTVPGQQGATDSYSLCFPGRDGFYEYLGQEFRKISLNITNTIDGLTQNNATRLEFNMTNQTQFQGAKIAGGGATGNIQADKYETDGLREDPGKIKVVNQLEYLGLGTGNASAASVGGKMIAMCKGPAEGEFFFSFDNDSKLYRTTDNFLTAAVAIDLKTSGDTPAANGLDHRIIEIVRRGTDEAYFLFTDTAAAGVSAGGMIFAWDQTAGIGLQIFTDTATTPLIYESDTLWQTSSYLNAENKTVNQINDGFFDATIRNQLFPSKDFFSLGSIEELGTTHGSNNIYLNHAQRLYLSVNQSAFSTSTLLSNPSLTGNSGSRVEIDAVISNGYFNSHPAGFYSVRDCAILTLTPPYVSGTQSYSTAFLRQGNSQGFRVQFTIREGAKWLGGTCRPQAFWDTVNLRLWFISAGAEDANGNRTTRLAKWEASNGNTISPIATGICQMALCQGEAGFAYLVDSSSSSSNLGFDPFLEKLDLAAASVSSVGALSRNFSYLRITYNANTGRIVGAGKSYNVSARNSYQYTGFISGINNATGAQTVLKAFTQNGNAGAFTVELVYQTNAPYKVYALMQNIQTGEMVASYSVEAAAAAASDVSVHKSGAYDANTTGLWSNAIFVPSSGTLAGSLWADRLYFFTKSSDVNKLLQLGIPGNWDVIGVFAGSAHNFGIFNAFDNLESDYGSGGGANSVIFEFKNAADAGAIITASYVIQKANQKIVGFNPPLGYAQWRATLTWKYRVDAVATATDLATVSSATDSPEISFVSIGYFLGNSNIPRVIGWQWDSRSCWAVSENGFLDNNLVLVYQHNNTWTTYRGWNIKGVAIFRNQLTALEGYELIQLEVGNTDLDHLISVRAKVMILSGNTDKTIRRIYANVMSYINKNFPTRSGWMKVISRAAGVDLDNKWFLPIPADTDVFQQQVNGVPTPGANLGWARALEIEFRTSDETEGDYVAVVDQPEEITSVILEMRESGPRRKAAYR